jgi:hypothetical protein
MISSAIDQCCIYEGIKYPYKLKLQGPYDEGLLDTEDKPSLLRTTWYVPQVGYVWAKRSFHPDEEIRPPVGSIPHLSSLPKDKSLGLPGLLQKYLVPRLVRVVVSKPYLTTYLELLQLIQTTFPQDGSGLFSLLRTLGVKRMEVEAPDLIENLANLARQIEQNLPEHLQREFQP